MLAYALPAVAVWAVVGAVANAVPVPAAALVLLALYGAYYGVIESAGRPGLPAPGRAWQVPSPWVDGAPRWRKLLVWGSLLGPGFATRNPYAGFGALVLVVACAGDLRAGIVLAAAIGLAHSAGRAGALLRDLRRGTGGDYLDSVLAQMRWRRVDGLAMLAACAAAVTAAAALPHL